MGSELLDAILMGMRGQSPERVSLEQGNAKCLREDSDALRILLAEDIDVNQAALMVC
jgi:hypothetical protein